ncbi:MAG TPA: MurR/RpiR family transcriptional regulator [Mesotoga infera]|uniref:MurR/RpiR family transcriptional regulator n=1 Tax=Mesotoga infera TaxID=1236046 RepID=A0A7C1GYP0_9BACT|nr:MurR/RpiR family transcriptional regulator [Mesotoga infera]
MSSLLQSYNEALHLLTETEEKIVSFVMNNPEQSLELSIHDLATRLEISPSMIVKAAKKLGFTGYTQLKLAIASELNILVQREKSSILIEDLKAYDELVSTTIKEAYCRLSEELIEEAARVLSLSQIVDIYAFGFDAVAGHDLYLKMLQCGKRVQLIQNGYEQMISAYSLESNSVVVAISSTGSSVDLIDALRFSKKTGASVVTITPAGSKLSDYSSINLESYYSKLVFPEGGLVTRIVQLMIVDVLYMKFLQISGGRFEERYSRFREVLDFKRRGAKK